MSQKTFPDNTDNRQLLITGTDPYMYPLRSAIKESEPGAWPNGYSRVFVQLMNS